VVAGLVREASAGEVPLAELVAAHPGLGPDAAAVLEPGAAVRRRTSAGGAGPGPVAEQLRRFDVRLDLDRARISG
jgi:argininosuccinate lyase